MMLGPSHRLASPNFGHLKFRSIAHGSHWKGLVENPYSIVCFYFDSKRAKEVWATVAAPDDVSSVEYRLGNGCSHWID